MTTYMVSLPFWSLITRSLIGVGMGLLFGSLLVAFDVFFKKFNLRSFNIAVVGIFIGYLMGTGLVLILNAILEISQASFVLQPQILEILKIAIFLFGIHLGTIMTLRSADEIYISIPFIKFKPTVHKKKDLLVDGSVLADSRIIDLASSGILNHHLVIPRLIIKELYALSETGDEITKAKSRRSLETLKKLEEIPGLDMRYNDTDFPEVKEQMNKLVRLARLLDANILTADISRIKTETIEGVRIINIHALSNALKPLMQAGEHIKIKIQRYGKEPRQGVGYLEDGTMVVVNGGGDYIGQVIDVHVLSVKHTASGRMIFCNAKEDEGYPVEEEEYEEEE